MNKKTNNASGGGGSQFSKSVKSPFLPAFTMAEALTVLGIIGIIALLVLPGAVASYREHEAMSKLKKMIFTISDALNSAINEYGDIDGWNLAAKSGTYDSQSATRFANYIKPYLKVIKDCGTETSNQCMDSTYYNRLNGNVWNVNYGTNTKYYKMILADGQLIWLRTNGNGCTNSDENTDTENVCANIWVDINGNSNQPNQIGKDTFIIYVTPDGITYSSDDDCYLNSVGWSCARYIMQHGNMNYPKT